MRTIKAAWEATITKSGNKFSPEVLESMEVMFYTGAGMMYFMLINAVDEGSEPTENDMAMMSAIGDELMAFKERVLVKAAQYRATKEQESGQATTGA